MQGRCVGMSLSSTGLGSSRENRDSLEVSVHLRLFDTPRDATLALASTAAAAAAASVAYSYTRGTCGKHLNGAAGNRVHLGSG